MKALLAVLATSLFSIVASAAITVTTVEQQQTQGDIDKNVGVLVCAASTYENEAALAIETLKNVNIYAIDLITGDMVDAGALTAPFQMEKLTSTPGANNTVVNTYLITGTTVKATVTYIVGAKPADIKVVGVTLSDSLFTAPTLVRDDAQTKAIVDAGNAGFSCSTGKADIAVPISGLASKP